MFVRVCAHNRSNLIPTIFPTIFPECVCVCVCLLMKHDFACQEMAGVCMSVCDRERERVCVCVCVPDMKNDFVARLGMAGVCDCV